MARTGCAGTLLGIAQVRGKAGLLCSQAGSEWSGCRGSDLAQARKRLALERAEGREE